MSKNFDAIATVDISISSPISSDASFDDILIVGAMPLVPNTDGNEDPVYPAEFAAYASMEEVTDAGWSATADTPDPVAVAAQVAFSQSPRPTRIFIAPIPTGSGKTIQDAVTTALTYSGWYVCCPAITVSDSTNIAKLGAVAAMIEAEDKMFCYTELGFFAADPDATTVVGEYYRTIPVFGRRSSSEADADLFAANNYINVAFAAKWLAYESGSETAAFKQLAVVLPADLTSAEMNALAAANVNYLMEVGGRNVTMVGKTLAGEWCDIIRFRDWLKNDMQVRVVNLFIANPKVPYTDSGIALVQNQMLASLMDGQMRGGIADSEYDENGNENPGFVTSVPESASIPASDKAARILHNCKFAARLAGAIHFAEIKGSLTYEL
jgi:hypothetical protein